MTAPKGKWGGARPGGGRPKGRRDSKTEARLKAAEAGGITPLEYMLGLLRDPKTTPEVRLDCAKAAAPYLHARLSSVDVKATVAHDGTAIPANVSPEQAQREYLDYMRAGHVSGPH